MTFAQQKQSTNALLSRICRAKEQLPTPHFLDLFQHELARALALCLNMDEAHVSRALTLHPKQIADYDATSPCFSLKNDLVNWINLMTSQDNDHWGELYQKMYSKKTRQLQGEFYTPLWLTRHLWDRARFHCEQDTPLIPLRIVDPACGSGSFLLACADSMFAAGFPAETVMDSLFGFDINPLSVLICRANILLACMRRLSVQKRNQWGESWTRLESGYSPIGVYLYDSIQGVPLSEDFILPPREYFNQRFDVVVGNPPWINWDKLSDVYRQETYPLWIQYGLFSLSGQEARLGGAKKELASLMLYRVADRFLENKGILAMVLPWSLFQTQKSGEGFRSMRLGPRGDHLGILEIDDFTNCPPFPGIMSRCGTLVLRKGVPTVWPVPCRKWSILADGQRSFSQESVSPLQPDRPVSPWIVSGHNDLPIASTTQYQPQLGCNSAGANNIFWFEMVAPGKKLCRVRNLTSCGKTEVEQCEIELETALLFPLLRWKNIDTFKACPSGFVLITQDASTRRGIPESVMKEHYPRTFDYLCRFESILRKRACTRKLQKGTPFWSMYNVNEKTFAPFKVVWRRMDNRLRAAATGPDKQTGRPIVPQETCCLIAVDSMQEADYLAAVLNSDAVQNRVKSLCVAQTRGFGSPGIFAHLGVEKFDPLCQEHIAFAQQGKRARGLID
ncbi:MAG: N-6 DNA methylase [Thermoguttaceae bacterium]|nr:N-6 DNA methylase [Thermoguttaceae bacterium]